MPTKLLILNDVSANALLCVVALGMMLNHIGLYYFAFKQTKGCSVFFNILFKERGMNVQ